MVCSHLYPRYPHWDLSKIVQLWLDFAYQLVFEVSFQSERSDGGRSLSTEGTCLVCGWAVPERLQEVGFECGGRRRVLPGLRPSPKNELVKSPIGAGHLKCVDWCLKYTFHHPRNQGRINVELFSIDFKSCLLSIALSMYKCGGHWFAFCWIPILSA